MEVDDYSQQHPDYDGANMRPGRRRSGCLSRAGEQRKKARYRAAHRAKYNAYMRVYMATRRAAAK